jgi:hypothetical protein
VTVKLEMTSKERISCGVKDYITFLKVDGLLNEKEYFLGKFLYY